METIRIFLVDDSIGFIFSAEDFLKTFPQVALVGHEMSPHKALAKIPTLNVDVVLLDLVMTEMDGLEFLHSIKKPAGCAGGDHSDPV